ncbi:hypothetical protein HELRODRAFT_182940 [Helobdella robusta]|uniref:Uncharacterized protein n=1 Tax=Helobdella robusta TaxID=6412 RepID=T1FIY2_HELRO|nr:hypothetical protein HELRODRAFT_182940 [Helobdella robusta]ESN90034.1 hypothetical protein HELRODRAFT_182940 [Helobdella robusta]
MDCMLESSKKGGGKLSCKHTYYEQQKCVEAVFEDSEIAKAFIERGKIEISKKDFILSNLPPQIYLPQKKFRVGNKVVVQDIKPPNSAKKLGSLVTPPRKEITNKEAGDSQKKLADDSKFKKIVKNDGDDDRDNDDSDEDEDDVEWVEAINDLKI